MGQINSSTPKIRLAVAGACGRMGRSVVNTASMQSDIELVGAVDQMNVGEDIGTIATGKSNGVHVQQNLADVIADHKPQVLVDFTNLGSAMNHIAICLDNGVIPVVGASGFSEQNLGQLREAIDKANVPVLIIPNFAIGAVLMMSFSQQAAKYFPNAEIIEMHHDKKTDAPSGTAIRTAEMIAAGRSENPKMLVQEEKFEGARGADVARVPVHSVRLSGYIAHQMVLFGGNGETLTLRHDSIDRESFMGGVMLAVRQCFTCKGLVVGLEHIL